MERNGWKFRITCIGIDHSTTFWNISKVSKNIFVNFKQHKFALISETVRDRAKWMKIWDHMHWQ